MRIATSLTKFHRFGGQGDARAEYRSVNGEAPPFIDGKPKKYWEDPDAPDDQLVIRTYKRLPTAGEPLRLIEFRMTGADARHVNLPGLAMYAPYDPAPSSAIVGLPGQAAQLLDRYLLSSAAEAAQLKAEVGGTGITYDTVDGGGLAITYNPGDARRVWVVLKGTARLNVGLLLKAKWMGGITDTDNSAGSHVSSGVGSPGHWDLSKPQPAWVPDKIDLGHGIDNQMPEVAEPVNSLATGETLVRAGFTNQLFVQTAEEAAAGTGDPGTGNAVGLPLHFAAEWAESRAHEQRTDVTLALILAALKKAGIE